jgi:hypothetical protein
MRTILFLLLLTPALAQTYWDQPTQGKGLQQSAAYRYIATNTQQEVFVVIPALYADVAEQLLVMAQSGKSVRVVLQQGGLSVSNGLPLIKGSRIQVRVVNTSQKASTAALFLLDKHILVTGVSLWDSRKTGWKWHALPMGTTGNLLDQLRLLWQAGKSL